ncbi:MAG: coproporphyrinogen-III oxidase family protein [Bacteroidetes bacterium]|nr:coproporphyrinogen-III oxidase family protein [Bacteroidota bacterium]
MAGIYIHIPFCRRKCHYCNFFSLASQKLKGPFLQAIKKEIAATQGYLAGEPVNTIYFGGGTPSLFRPSELQDLFDPTPVPSRPGNTSPPDPSPRGEGRNMPVFSMEITLELNPEDVTEDYVAQLKGTWFNRFSLGVQSFSDEDLVYLNRSHSAGQALQAVKLLQRAGYENISIDLIYGIPSSSGKQWQKNLETAFSLGVPHISAYALTVEPKTPLAWMIAKQKSEPVSEVAQIDQFNMLMEKAKKHGFLQYEISNFCQPGYHAVHNTNYWNGIPYLGIGPSAHSYNGTSRRWNMSNLSKYIEGMDKGGPNYEEEILTPAQKFNEYAMTSLRTMWGFEPGKMNYELKIMNYELIRKRAASFVERGFMTEQDGVYFLTDSGKLFADQVASELFILE